MAAFTASTVAMNQSASALHMSTMGFAVGEEDVVDVRCITINDALRTLQHTPPSKFPPPHKTQIVAMDRTSVQVATTYV